MKKAVFSIFLLLALVLPLLSGGAVAQEPANPDDRLPGETAADSPPPGLRTPELVASGSSPAEYDSGWVKIQQDEAITLTHALGGNPDTYVVDMTFRASGVDGINQRYYGGADFGDIPAPGHAANDRVGAYWRTLTADTITIYRRPEDTYAEWIRVRIAIEPFSNYDSGWVALGAGAAATVLNHNLGLPPEDYLVDMQYRGAGDVNQRYYGGVDFGALAFDGGANDDRVAAYWRSLDANTITVFRRDEDIYASEVRVRLWVRPQATYDSGWVALLQDSALTINHNIGGNVEDYYVDMEFRSVADGINQRHYGGADFGALAFGGTVENDRVGAYWRSLDETSITVYRRPQDPFAEEVRIRIFNYWRPTPPDYDSGWQEVITDTAVTLNHALGGSTSDYLVNVLQRAEDINGINNRYQGGSDFGTSPAPGHSAEDRVGLYWRSLTTNNITIYRRPEDNYAVSSRVRIWQMPKPDYDSGWIAKAPGEAATTLMHNLGGDYQGDLLVDFQYRSALDGVNQRYYGGADFGALAFTGTAENERHGAYWRNLDNDSITIYRRPDDIYAEEMRVRIWRVAPADFDSSWVSLSQDVSQTLTFEIKGIPDAFLVDMFQWDTSSDNLLNQRHLGGADFGNLPPLGYAENDRVGAYWRTLTDSEVTVYRRPEDSFSEFIRIRIWDTTQRIFMPLAQKQ